MVIDSRDPLYGSRLDEIQKIIYGLKKYYFLRIGEISSRKCGPYFFVIFFKEDAERLLPAFRTFHYSKTIAFRLELKDNFNKRFKESNGTM